MIVYPALLIRFRKKLYGTNLKINSYSQLIIKMNLPRWVVEGQDMPLHGAKPKVIFIEKAYRGNNNSSIDIDKIFQVDPGQFSELLGLEHPDCVFTRN